VGEQQGLQERRQVVVEPERRTRGSIPQWPAAALAMPHSEHHLRTAETPLRNTFRERVIFSTASGAHSMHSNVWLIMTVSSLSPSESVRSDDDTVMSGPGVQPSAPLHCLNTHGAEVTSLPWIHTPSMLSRAVPGSCWVGGRPGSNAPTHGEPGAT